MVLGGFRWCYVKNVLLVLYVPVIASQGPSSNVCDSYYRVTMGEKVITAQVLTVQHLPAILKLCLVLDLSFLLRLAIENWDDD